MYRWLMHPKAIARCWLLGLIAGGILALVILMLWHSWAQRVNQALVNSWHQHSQLKLKLQQRQQKWRRQKQSQQRKHHDLITGEWRWLLAAADDLGLATISFAPGPKQLKAHIHLAGDYAHLASWVLAVAQHTYGLQLLDQQLTVADDGSLQLAVTARWLLADGVGRSTLPQPKIHFEQAKLHDPFHSVHASSSDLNAHNHHHTCPCPWQLLGTSSYGRRKQGIFRFCHNSWLTLSGGQVIGQLQLQAINATGVLLKDRVSGVTDHWQIGASKCLKS